MKFEKKNNDFLLTETSLHLNNSINKFFVIDFCLLFLDPIFHC